MRNTLSSKLILGVVALCLAWVCTGCGPSEEGKDLSNVKAPKKEKPGGKRDASQFFETK